MLMKEDSLKDLIQKAWLLRKECFGNVIYFAVPGVKKYCNRYYSNKSSSFVNISITGNACALCCAHCRGKLLQTMVPAATPDKMCRVVDYLAKKGCKGILVSGGSNSRGEVPLLPFIKAIKYAKNAGLIVLVHAGLIQVETAIGLKEACVDQVLLDIIGHESTIRLVYHLDKQPDDYLKSMLICRELGLNIAPHVVIGLHFGHILGEMRALEMIGEVKPETLVLVILTPTCGTSMEMIDPPAIEKVASIMVAARLSNPGTPLTLGCARPPGKYKQKVEKIAVDCGINGIAYPDDSTISYAEGYGLRTVFFEECCSLVSRRLHVSV